MDNSELAKEVLNTLSPFLVAGGQEIIKGAAKDLWSQIKLLFIKRGDEGILDEIESNPLDEKLKGKIEYILESELKDNEGLPSIFYELLEKLKASSDFKNQIIQSGDNNISVAGQITNSSINIHKP